MYLLVGQGVFGFFCPLKRKPKNQEKNKDLWSYFLSFSSLFVSACIWCAGNKVRFPKEQKFSLTHSWINVEGAEIRFQMVCLQFFPLLYYVQATSKFGTSTCSPYYKHTRAEGGGGCTTVLHTRAGECK